MKPTTCFVYIPHCHDLVQKLRNMSTVTAVCVITQYHLCHSLFNSSESACDSDS